MKTLGNSRGQTIVFVALFFVIILAFVGLAINTGLLTYVKNQGQAAVDASALAGAAAIPNYNTTANANPVLYPLAESYNANNTVLHQSANITGATDVQFCSGLPFDNPTCTLTPADPAKVAGVRVTKTYNTPVFLSGFLDGDTSKNLTVSATAWLGGPVAGSPDLPVALCAEQINYNPDDPTGFSCSELVGADLTPNNDDNAGWWSLGDPTSASLCKKLVDGTVPIPDTTTGETINLNNGEITSCHKAIENKFAAAGCFQQRITHKELLPDGTEIEIVDQEGVPGAICTTGTEDEREACTVTLPVVDCPNSINQQQPIIGYASVCIDYVQSNPASNAIFHGDLACNVEAAGTPGGGVFLGTYAAAPALVK